MCVKLTYTFSAAGIMALVFITVNGLTEQELPEYQCLSIKIISLCVRGGGVTLGNEKNGVLLFLRGDKGMDVEQYRIYKMKYFYLLFKNHDPNFMLKKGDPITNNLMVIRWCDGDLA